MGDLISINWNWAKGLNLYKVLICESTGSENGNQSTDFLPLVSIYYNAFTKLKQHEHSQRIPNKIQLTDYRSLIHRTTQTATIQWGPN